MMKNWQFSWGQIGLQELFMKWMGATESRRAESDIISFFTKIALFCILVCLKKFAFPTLGAVLRDVSHILIFFVKYLFFHVSYNFNVFTYMIFSVYLTHS